MCRQSGFAKTTPFLVLVSKISTKDFYAYSIANALTN